MRIENYSLFLDFSSGSDDFAGVVRIGTTGNAEEVRLDSLGLQIRNVSIGGERKEFSIDQPGQSLTIHAPVSGDTVIEIQYAGVLSSSVMGVYRAGGGDGEFITTMFEPTGARTVFPCVDEPGCKATFEVEVATRPGFEALSNMPVEETHEMGGKKFFRFRKTPRMSTYLLYVGVGKFNRKTESANGCDYMLITPVDQETGNDYPLATALKTVGFLEDYFGIRYMLPTLQLISVPEFAAGAMEQWGAITFREGALNTFDNSSHQTMRYVAIVIAHEIAHQWFGNLVTMKWWNDLWLKESFATYMGTKAVDHAYPEYRIWNDFITSEQSGAFHGDALESSHPIDVPVKDTHEVAQIFDEISYGKGASLLRMIESYIGSEKFRRGVGNYLAKFSYSNAVSEDLWNSLEQASGLPVSRIMSDWVGKKGFPLIEVSLDQDEFVLTQNRFSFSGKPSDDLWIIPVTLERNGKLENVLMEERTMRIQSGGITRFNPDRTGFYRLKFIGEAGKFAESSFRNFSEIDTWGKASDLFAFMEASVLSVQEYLDSISPLFTSKSSMVVELIAKNLNYLLLLGRENHMLREKIRQLCNLQIDNFGMSAREGEDGNISYLRDLLLTNLAFVDAEFARSHGSQFNDLESVDPNLRGSVSIAFAISTNDFGELHRAFLKSTTEETRSHLLRAMGWLEGEENFGKIMEMLESGAVKKQDMIHAVFALSSNLRMLPYVNPEFENFVETARKYLASSGMEGTIIERISPYLGVTEPVEFEKRLRAIDGPDIDMGVRKALEGLAISRRIFLQLSEEPVEYEQN